MKTTLQEKAEFAEHAGYQTYKFMLSTTYAEAEQFARNQYATELERNAFVAGWMKAYHKL